MRDIKTTKPTCEADAGGDKAARELRKKVYNHPCYCEDAHTKYARIHLPVAPACNIQCNYCNRKYDCSNESRPGVVSEVLAPDEALKKVLFVKQEIPQLSVVGIAGPGDGLANPDATFKTLSLVKEYEPSLKPCLSTNGLALIDHIDDIIKTGIDHVTVTMNATDPAIAAEIYEWIIKDGRKVFGIEGAAYLIDRQLAGIKLLVDAGILVKINSVLIPGVNDHHLVELAKTLKELGVFIHNIVPLISDPAHGTRFGLAGQRGPSPDELARVQADCAGVLGGFSKLMKHCKQCRADAVGFLGRDRFDDFTREKLNEVFADKVRGEWTQRISDEVAAGSPLGGHTVRVAIATRGGGIVNEHFGRAIKFRLYEASDAGVTLVEKRNVEAYCVGSAECGEHDGRLGRILRTVTDVNVIACVKVGPHPETLLKKAGISATDAYAYDVAEKAVWLAAKDHLGIQTTTAATAAREE